MNDIFYKLFLWFIKLKIKTKIIIGMGIVLSLFFIFSIIIVWTITEITRCQNLSEFSYKSISNMRLARINEKDFFYLNDEKSLNEHKKSIESLINNLNKLSKIETNKEFTSNIKILVSLTNDYNESFKKVVTLFEERGIDENSGLLKKLKENSEQLLKLLERTNPQINMSFYKIVFYQKNYEQYKSNEYIINFGNEITVLEKLLSNNSIEFNLLEEYRNLFYQIMAIDTQITGEKEEFNQYINKIEPVMNKYNLYIIKLINFIKIRSLIITFLIFLILLIIGIITSIITIKGVTSPIKTISNSTGKIKKLTFFLATIVRKNANETIKMTNSMENINILIKNQNNALTESTGSIEEMTDNLKNISNIALLEKINIEKMIENIKITKEEIEELVKHVFDIKNNSGIMLETSDIISSVASKTRILSFNAGIEAANAGENGRVLRVVAKEIKKLSDQSNFNAINIKEHINKNVKILEKSSEKSEIILNNFINFSEEIKKSIVSIVDIINKIQNIAINTNIVMDKLDNLIFINEKVKNSGNEMKFMAKNINESIKYLVDIKSNTNNEIHSILESINQMTDNAETIIQNINEEDHEIEKLKMYFNKSQETALVKYKKDV